MSRSMSKESEEKFNLCAPVFLVGFMGAGKTSVARRLSRICGLSCIDLDSYIERLADTSISDIFEKVGEEGFRAIETQALKDVASMEEPQLISCGGGVVLRSENRELMKRTGTVVYLEVTADQASMRISDKSTRPLFNDIESVRKRLTERIPIYEQASDISIETNGKSVGKIAYDLKRALAERDVLIASGKRYLRTE